MGISAIKCFPMITVNFFILKNIRNLISYFFFFFLFLELYDTNAYPCSDLHSFRPKMLFFFCFCFDHLSGIRCAGENKNFTYVLHTTTQTNDKKSNSDNKLLLKRCIEECQISLHNFYTNQNCRNF